MSVSPVGGRERESFTRRGWRTTGRAGAGTLPLRERA